MCTAEEYARRYKEHYDDSREIFPIGDDVLYVSKIYEKSEIENGIYLVEWIEDDICLIPLELSFDRYIHIDDNMNLVMKDIDDFFSSEKKYIELNITHRRSILLHGNAGNGKTLIANNVAMKYEKDAVIIYVMDLTFIDDLLPFRKHFKDRNVIFVLEKLQTRYPNFIHL